MNYYLNLDYTVEERLEYGDLMGSKLAVLRAEYIAKRNGPYLEKSWPNQ
jgi:hypothetical protein